MTQETGSSIPQKKAETRMTLPGVVFDNDPITIPIPERLYEEPFDVILAEKIILDALAAYIDPNYVMTIIGTLLFAFTDDKGVDIKNETTVSRRFRYVNGSIVLL